MKINICRYFIKTVVIYVLLLSLAYSVSMSTLPHTMLLSDTDKVVLAKLINKKKFTYLNNEDVCAFELEFAVKNSWKGGDKSFTILASADNFDMIEGNDYLVFAMENKNKIRLNKNSPEFQCNGSNVSGLDTHYKFTQIWAAQAIFPVLIDDETDENWLVIYDFSNVREELPPTNLVTFGCRFFSNTSSKVRVMKMSDFIGYLFTS